MKKYLPVFLSLLLFLLLASQLNAQEFNFNKAYDDYLYNYNQYRQANTEYISAKQAHSSYQTLTSKEKAMEKTSNLLKNEDEVIKTYLTALRLKLAETTGISNYEQNVIYLKLDNEVIWYQNHQSKLSSAGSLEDLVKSGEEMKQRYQETQILAYQTLGAILAGKQNYQRQQINQQIQLLKEKIGVIRQTGDKQTATVERWLLEAENRLTRSQEKEFEAQQLLTKMKNSDRDKNKIYNQAQSQIEESHQYLKEANRYLREIIREVKSAD